MYVKYIIIYSLSLEIQTSVLWLSGLGGGGIYKLPNKFLKSRGLNGFIWDVEGIAHLIGKEGMELFEKLN